MTQKTSLIEPTVCYRNFPGVIIRAFAKPTNWAIGGDENWESANSFVPVANLARELGIREILAPRANLFNGLICDGATLNKKFDLGGIRIRTGCFADGVELVSGQAFWIASADCPTIVAYSQKGRVIAAHAGRDSLFDRKAVISGKKQHHKGIVNEILRAINESPRQIYVFSCCGIDAKHYKYRPQDPKYGEGNKKIIHYLCERYPPDGPFIGNCLDLHHLIRLQFMEFGIPPQNIRHDSVDTCGERKKWWSCARGDKERNGILVSRD